MNSRIVGRNAGATPLQSILPQVPARARNQTLPGRSRQPDTAQGLFALAMFHYERGDLHQARDLFVASLRLDSGQLSAHARLGDIALRLGNLQAAQIHLERVADIVPSDSFTNIRLAKVYQRQGYLPRAIALLEYNVAANKGDRYALLALSKATSTTPASAPNAGGRRINDENAPLQLVAPKPKASTTTKRTPLGPPRMVASKAEVLPPSLSVNG